MASMLSLPDECLHSIFSFIDDPSSYKSVTLTCKRFYQATENARIVLHRNLLRVKAEYLIKCWMVDRREKYDGHDLVQLLGECARLTARKSLLTYDKVVDVWQRNGPVAAKLYTWTRKNDIIIYAGSTEKRVLTLHLPSCDRNMVIETRNTPSFFTTHEDIVDLRSTLQIHVTCGDLKVNSLLVRNVSPEDHQSWVIEHVKGAMETMKAVLQKELGDTAPPITNHFFIWLCFFFPDRSNLLGENRLSFKEAARNTKPNVNSVQTAIVEFHNELQFENSLQKLLTTWINKTRENQTQYPNMIARIIRLFSQRSETKVLERLEDDACRFNHIAIYHDTRQLPCNAMLDLLLRTSLEASTNKRAAIVKKYAENRVSFRCTGGKVMKIRGSVQGDGSHYSTWEKLELEFTLPDGNVLKLESPLDLMILGPVTDLLQEGFNQIRHGTQNIPKMNNFLTAVYFINALEFDDACSIAFDSFDLTRFPESEEEPDYWESSPEPYSYYLENEN